jgi:H+/Cl- antiporter ClcA
MAFLGAVGHVLLPVMVMIAEITGSYQLLAPGMIAVSLAYVIIGNYTSDIVADYMFWQKSSKPPQNDAQEHSK